MAEKLDIAERWKHPTAYHRIGGGKPGARVPQRRAIVWAEALAATTAELERQKGRQRAEASLRAVGARLSGDMLTPLPASYQDLEPQLNRSLNSLDWGSTTIIATNDELVFEHRAPWPFVQRPDELVYVLEGFFTDVLRRMGHDPAMRMGLTGKHGDALMFRWGPPNLHAAEEPPPARPLSPEPPLTARVLRPVGRSSLEIFAALDHMRERPKELGEAARQPLVPERLQFQAPIEPHSVLRSDMQSEAPVQYERHEPSSHQRSISVLLVAATIFVLLLAFGLLTNGGDIIDRAADRMSRMLVSNAHGSMSSAEQSARRGDSDAQIQLALDLVASKNTQPDYEDAARWFKLAASSGSAEAQYDLGVMAAFGLGMKRDEVEAAILYLRAADGGFSLAEYRLGEAFESGHGVRRDGANAAMWYERAARHGVPQAQTALGRLRAAGTEIASDMTLAYAWYRLAERMGDSQAANQRATLVPKLTPEQLAAAQRLSDRMISEIEKSGAGAFELKRPTVDQVTGAVRGRG